MNGKSTFLYFLTYFTRILLVSFRDKDGKLVKQTLALDCDMIPIQSSPGTACVLWFTDLKDLVDLYMNNIEKSKKKDTFYLSKIKIEDYVDIPENWYNFIGWI